MLIFLRSAGTEEQIKNPSSRGLIKVAGIIFKLKFRRNWWDSYSIIAHSNFSNLSNCNFYHFMTLHDNEAPGIHHHQSWNSSSPIIMPKLQSRNCQTPSQTKFRDCEND